MQEELTSFMKAQVKQEYINPYNVKFNYWDNTGLLVRANWPGYPGVRRKPYHDQYFLHISCELKSELLVSYLNLSSINDIDSVTEEQMLTLWEEGKYDIIVAASHTLQIMLFENKIDHIYCFDFWNGEVNLPMFRDPQLFMDCILGTYPIEDYICKKD